MKKLFGKIKKDTLPHPGSEGIKRFKDVQNEEEAFDFEKRGMHSVSLSAITGSVSRYNDFDARFHLKPGRPVERLENIKNAMRNGQPLPPVELYQIKDEFYILDGNNRVAAAKELGLKEINAHIVECLPQKKSWENILYLEKRHFYKETGLSEEIELTEAGQYPFLLQQIQDHRHNLESQSGKEVPLETASRDWYDTIYLPFVTMIGKRRFQHYFPHRTLSDYFVYITIHQGKDRDTGEEILDAADPDGISSASERKTIEEHQREMAEKENVPYSDMLREIIAFVLLRVDTRNEKNILQKISALDEVVETHAVHGELDVLVKIVLTRDLLVSDAETIGRFVQDRIRRIPGVTSSQTLIPSWSFKKGQDKK